MRTLSTILFVLLLIAGVGFFIYPEVASWWNNRYHVGLGDTYRVDIAQMRQEQLDAQLQRALDFNAALTEVNVLEDPDSDVDVVLPEDYFEILNIRGIIGMIEVPVVNIYLPIRHGTSTHTLDRGAGHMAGTHFPVGGYGTHSVITAHSGFANSRLFIKRRSLRVNFDYNRYYSKKYR